MISKSILGLSLFTMLYLTGCVRVKTEPIVIEPIYIEITVNHKIQKELNNYFNDLDRSSEALQYKEIPK